MEEGQYFPIFSSFALFLSDKLVINLFWLQNPIAKHMNRLWVIMEPLLFGLIGIEADIKMVKGQVIGKHINLNVL